MRERDTDPLRDHYIEGMKRLVAISEKNGSPEEVNEDRMPKKSDKHVCLVCGNMWDIDPEKREKPKKCPSCTSIMWNNSGLKRHRCKQCSHMWMSKLDSPLACPKCRSKLWDKEMEKLICRSCGFEWNHRADKGPLEKCPDCQSEDLMPELVDCICKRCGYSGKMKSDRISRCPVCWTTLSVCREPSVYKEMEAYQRPNWNKIYVNSGSVLSAILRSDIDDTKKVIELGSEIGLDTTDAEILVRFSKGEDPVSIARAIDTSLNRVMMAANSLCGGKKDEGFK